MPAITTRSAPLLRQVENWASKNAGHADVEKLGADQIATAAKDLGVTPAAIAALRAGLVSSAAAGIENAGATSARDRDASAPVDLGHNGRALESSPAFARFAFAPAATAETSRNDGPAPLVALKPTFRMFDTTAEGDVALPAVGGVTVQKAEQRRFVGAQNTFLHKSALTTLDVRFGQLSADQFGALHQAFGGKSEVAFDASRDYDAIDFLPPTLQALVNQDLQTPPPVELPQSESLNDESGMLLGAGENKTIDLTANCHATGWEAMRAFQGDTAPAGVDLFLGDATTLDGLLYGDMFDTLQEKVTAAKDIDVNAMRPGDAIVYYDAAGFTPLHTAVYVGGGLFFEKPDTERVDGDAPYRLGTLDAVTTPVADFSGGNFQMRAVRPNKALVPGREAFASSFTDVVDAYAEAQGRPLGIDLVDVLEMRMGGGVSGAHLSGAVSVALTRDDLGRGVLARS